MKQSMKQSMAAAVGLCATLLLWAGCQGGLSSSAQPEEKMYQSRAASKASTAMAAQGNRDSCADYKSYHSNMRQRANSGEIYLGIGMAPIEQDSGQAREVARQRALSELSTAIQVKVASDIESITGYTREAVGRRDHEDFRQSVFQKVNTYSNIVLDDVQEGEPFHGCPEPGTLTMFMYLSREKYQQKVAQDMRNKLDFLKGRIQEGDTYLAGAGHVNALTTYLDAREKLEAFFGDLPVYAAIGAEERSVPLYLNTKIAGLLNGLTLENLTGESVYSVEGVLDRTPRIMAAFTDERGRKGGVAGLPLTAVIVSGSGRLGREELVTGRYGEAVIPVESVDASFAEVAMQVEVDWSRVPGMSAAAVGGAGLSPLPVILKRVRTVGLAVNFSNLGAAATSPGNLRQQLVSLLSSRNYGVTSVPAAGPADLRARPGLNVDYVLLINARSTGGATVGGYKNMHVADCSGEVALYRMPAVTLVASESIAGAQGFGSSADSAGWDAFGKIQSRLLDRAGSLLNRIN